MAEITARDVLDYSGEEDLEAVRDLVLRENDPPFTRFDPACAKRLRARSSCCRCRATRCAAASFRPLRALTELNLNFNEIGPTLFAAESSPAGPPASPQRLPKSSASSSSSSSTVNFSFRSSVSCSSRTTARASKASRAASRH